MKSFFCWRSNLSNDGIICLRTGVKTGMDFRGLVWKRVWKITNFLVGNIGSGSYPVKLSSMRWSCYKRARLSNRMLDGVELTTHILIVSHYHVTALGPLRFDWPWYIIHNYSRIGNFREHSRDFRVSNNVFESCIFLNSFSNLPKSLLHSIFPLAMLREVE